MLRVDALCCHQSGKPPTVCSTIDCFPEVDRPMIHYLSLCALGPVRPCFCLPLPHVFHRVKQSDTHVLRSSRHHYTVTWKGTQWALSSYHTPRTQSACAGDLEVSLGAADALKWPDYLAGRGKSNAAGLRPYPLPLSSVGAHRIRSRTTVEGCSLG